MSEVDLTARGEGLRDRLRRALGGNSRFVGYAVGLVALSRVVGVLRETVIVALVGVHDYTDAYFATSSIVLWLQNWSFGALALFLVPKYLSLSPDAREEWIGRWKRGTAGFALAAGAAFLAFYPWIQSAMLSGRVVLGTGPAALLAICIPFSAVAGVYYGEVVARPRGITMSAAGTLGANLAGVGVIAGVTLSGLDPSYALPASLATVQGGLLANLWWSARRLKREDDDPPAAAPNGAVASQVGATTAENVGFNVNAVLNQGIAGHQPPGAVSLSAYAMRLLLVPLTGLLGPVQQRLLIVFSRSTAEGARRVARRNAGIGLAVGTCAGAAAAGLLVATFPWWSAAWQRAFTEHRFALVLLGYGTYAGVVFSNQTLARFYFARGRGWTYAIAMLCAYAVETPLKLSIVGGLGIVALPIGALLAEGAATLWLLRTMKRVQS